VAVEEKPESDGALWVEVPLRPPSPFGEPVPFAAPKPAESVESAVSCAFCQAERE
jgi:hypothetical protein